MRCVRTDFFDFKRIIYFFFFSSDIDLIVHSKDGRPWKAEELEGLMLVLRDAFCRNRICTQEGIQILNGATVPIIKLTDRKTDIKVDMSFNMNNGLRSAQLILVCIKKIKLYYVIILFFFRKG
jgi:non-canonical poly(A) RNA polymerase PAPD5/7